MFHDSFGDYLRSTYPGVPEDQSMASLLREHGSLRGVARATGIALVTISRWGKRLRVTPPPPYPYLPIVHALRDKEGETAREKLLILFREEGSWVRVAARLGVDGKKLQGYRYELGMVPKEKFKERCEGGRGLFNMYDDTFGGDYGPG